MTMTADNVLKAAELIARRSGAQHRLATLKDAFDGNITNVVAAITVHKKGVRSTTFEVSLPDSDDAFSLFEVIRMNITAEIDMIEDGLEELGVEV